LLKNLQKTDLTQAVQLLQTIDAFLTSVYFFSTVLVTQFILGDHTDILHYNLQFLVKLRSQGAVFNRLILTVLVPLSQLVVYFSNFFKFFGAYIPTYHDIA
jgi:hypothetical protein